MTAVGAQKKQTNKPQLIFDNPFPSNRNLAVSSAEVLREQTLQARIHNLYKLTLTFGVQAAQAWCFKGFEYLVHLPGSNMRDVSEAKPIP